MSEPPYQMAGQSKKMAEEWLSSEQCNIIFKWYWKFENVFEVQRQWQHKFATEPPSNMINTCTYL
jgi:hypothetical protein